MRKKVRRFTLVQSNRLGEEKIGKLIFMLAVPTVISQLVNMLYNIVDRMYIGHIPEVGAEALTGLGLCFPIIMLVSAFSSLFGMGGAPQAAIEMGKGNNKKAEKILGNCVCALLSVALVLMVVLFLFGEDLLMLFGASENTIGYALDYLNVYAFGTIFVQIALGLNPFITTQGFAKYSMITVVLGAVLNIVLDPLFIFVFDMGVSGAATATIISQAASAIFVLTFLLGKKTTLKIRKENLRIDKKIMLPVVALGVSPFVMQSTESILNICFNVSLQKYGGDIAVGTMTIIGSVMQLAYMPMQGISQGAQPVTSYNYGAGKMDRVKAAIKIQIIACSVFAVTVWAAVMCFPQVFIGIFNKDPELMSMATWAMRVYAFGIFSLGVQMACQQTFVALGFAKVSLLLACLRKIILLIPLIFILPNFMDNKVLAVFLAEPVADILAAATTFTVFMVMARKHLTTPQSKDKGVTL